MTKVYRESRGYLKPETMQRRDSEGRPIPRTDVLRCDRDDSIATLREHGIDPWTYKTDNGQVAAERSDAFLSAMAGVLDGAAPRNDAGLDSIEAAKLRMRVSNQSMHPTSADRAAPASRADEVVSTSADPVEDARNAMLKRLAKMSGGK